ncbi:hypothetical protein BCIN_11g01460 [Botrytis cinerea B05.10]|uniref:Uncharacterized protein n=1 Tax=Botryotinia fuckeliana (strain B05.10) TaxID=332648 RepID=A0A384JX29_BOTFB|nr:hypothetical protein BCIN_11g01460 [Botrytis cinerea B05.10]ATZ54817.1 hypothetical protein BCIN_11g01460 [Botrytis cinerea B05.10]
MIRFQRNPDITQITTMPSKRNFFEMSGDAANTKAHPLDLIKDAIEVHEKIVKHKHQAIQKAEQSILRNQLKIEEYQNKIEELKKLNINLEDEHAEAREFVRNAEVEGRVLKATKKRGEELEKELLDSAKKEFADKMEVMLQETESQMCLKQNILLQIKREADP